MKLEVHIITIVTKYTKHVTCLLPLALSLLIAIVHSLVPGQAPPHFSAGEEEAGYEGTHTQTYNTLVVSFKAQKLGCHKPVYSLM